ncbi:MAG TPA: M14 family metallopeptidase [Cyclobacteriaceae bacterium]|nr:zinc carboxypeptidase [Cyclobacteriaceae bacterium]HMV07357.1 M14 family metallopeptidase [Cyclobacteriaceae bacterium]HMV88835.1 M14 family metallopeptidase [Cyclobacteriaceae bacterium]HMW99288.1 M14 family metallopeptidase [Cyclobacteriaceae bacterium]HMX48923.1 M14 family metallopeptidase [Cyclobacteriaceae bacterium]
MKKIAPLLITFAILFTSATAQVDLSYYLPDSVRYNPAIPTPKSIIGHEVGEWHVSHDKLVQYMRALDQASDRITIEVTGQSHEGQPLLLLTITSPANHTNIESIRAQHLRLSDPTNSGSLDVKNMPAVFYMGHSIHGNEPSGSNAAMLTAYFLAAAQGRKIEEYLNNTVILLDPSFNPDGLQRFSSWVNSRKSNVISIDPADIEHNEAWPGGRTNHYWFDLNRDWLVAQQPESQGRVKKFHAWKPNVLTDHHEMGTNATFFFQPGVPARVHPLTPLKNQELTRLIGKFHARALDSIGSLYYTQEGYDDFYYGKGSTFPDVQGAIGILFEQASSRGHAQESVNGVLRFPFTIRNQFVTALSTLAAVNAMRVDLLTYQRDFFKSALGVAAKDPVKTIAFGSNDVARATLLAEVIGRHGIDIQKLNNQALNGKRYTTVYGVSLNQPQYTLIKSMFEKRTQFADSMFYDISSWTLPLAYGVEYEELKTTVSGEKVTDFKIPAGKLIGGESEYAYVFEPTGYFVPRALNRLLQHNIRIKVATEPFFHSSGKKFERGSILVPVAGQEKSEESISYIITQILNDGIDVYAFNSGLDYQGVSLGSGSFNIIRKPEIALLVGDGVNSNDAGELWHLLDHRYQIPVTLLPVDVVSRGNLSKYNTIIFPAGSYNSINDSGKEKLKTWVQNGGVIIGFENALQWLQSAGIGKFEMKSGENADKQTAPRSYASLDEYRGAQESPGAIFEASVDVTHPLLYGYDRPTLSIFKSNNIFLEKSKNPYANPVTFGNSPLQSGYISKQNYTQVKNSSVAGVSALGAGRVIGFTDNLCFRAFWLGTNKLFTNAIFYGPTISSGSAR